MTLILRLFALCILAAFALAAATLTMPRVIPNALPGHMEHAEALRIRECAQEPSNILQVWANSSAERLNCLIMTPEGVADYVIAWSCKRAQFIEITAYLFKQPTIAEAVKILTAKGCKRVY